MPCCPGNAGDRLPEKSDDQQTTPESLTAAFRGRFMGYNSFRTRRAARMVSSLVCQTSNSEKPGRPMGTPSRRKIIRLSSTCLPDMWKACAPVSAARAGRLAGVTPAPTRISRSGPAASTSRRSREAPAGALAACPLVRMVPRFSALAASSAAKGSLQTSKARCRVQDDRMVSGLCSGPGGRVDGAQRIHVQLPLRGQHTGHNAVRTRLHQRGGGLGHLG